MFELRAIDTDGFVVRHPLRCRESQVVGEAIRLHRAFSDVRVEVWREGLLVTAVPLRH